MEHIGAIQYMSWCYTIYSHFSMVYDNSLLGDADVPVADCNDIHFSSHPKTTWKLNDYLSYWKQLQISCKKTTDEDFGTYTEKRLLYLKDWHFTK